MVTGRLWRNSLKVFCQLLKSKFLILTVHAFLHVAIDD
jgi:hypothetical protein